MTLLNHVRDGVVAHLPAGAVPDGRRATLTVRASLNGAAAPEVPLTLLGPADARDLDPRAIIRMDPPPGAQGSEPNLFCLVEFDRPDLPWLFTPGGPDAAGRLQPWIALVVVERREGVTLEDPRGGRPALLHVDDPAELPPPDQLWAWAHAQVSGPAGTPGELAATLRGAPAATLSRLLCPRLLRPHTSYLACVVPTFESGRRAGAGQPDPEVAGPAWTATAVNGPLPVYHHWHFVTGAPGDFEALVRRIRATVPPAGMGTVDLDIADPGADALRAPGATLPFPGALRSPGAAAPAWDDAVAQGALADLVDASAGPVVGPPLHGGAAAGVRAVPAGAQPRPHWLRDLNLDPRHRGAAALGARIVIENQEELMAAAWRQAGAIEEANRRLRAARLARRAGQAVVRRRLAPLGAGALLGLGAPAMDRLPRVAGEPFRVRLAATRLPLGLTEPAFRRLTRPGGHLGVHLGGRGGAPAVAEAIDAGRAVPDRGLTGRPGGLVTMEGLIALAEAARAGGGRGTPTPVVTGLPVTGPGARPPTVSGAPGGERGTLRLRIRDTDRELGGGSLTVDGIKAPSKAALGRMRATLRGELLFEKLPGRGVITVAGKEQALDAEIRAGLGEALREPAVAPVPAAPTGLLDGLRAELLSALDPAVAVPAALAREVVVAHLRRAGEDPLDEVLAAPVIPAPLAPELAAISGDLLLPGGDRMPADSCCALVTNPAYVQALLVGANHEMGRELRWRGFPTDQRGTVLHHFWDTRGTVAPPADPPADIRDIHRFAPAGRLGAEVGGGRQDVVLLVRAEVFRRYPGTQVVAMPAIAAAGGRRPDYTAPALPRFRGIIGADLHYFGFAFDDVAARGSGGATGWYAVFQQPPGAPRFGLDEAPSGTAPTAWPATPDGLTWGHVLPEAAAAPGQGPAPTGHIRLPDTPTAFAGLAGVRWGAGGAAQARSTWQQQVRVAIHFDDLLDVAP